MPTNGNSNTVASGQLAKAKLIHESNNDSQNIEFMFNPTELVFQQSITLSQSQGAYTERGLPKVSFAYPNLRTLNISNCLFDTYEKGTNVMEHINKLIKAIEFADAGDGTGKRPSIYVFTWGQQQYLRCFIEQLTYRLTRFLADGTPVQSRVDLSLKEVDEVVSQADSRSSVSVDRSRDSRSSRS